MQDNEHIDSNRQLQIGHAEWARLQEIRETDSLAERRNLAERLLTEIEDEVKELHRAREILGTPESIQAIVNTDWCDRASSLQLAFHLIVLVDVAAWFMSGMQVLDV